MSQLLGTIRSEITQAASRLGLTQKTVAELAQSVEERVCREHGGDETYTPSQDRCRRDSAIRPEWSGANRAELCRRYRVSKSTLYRILRESR